MLHKFEKVEKLVTLGVEKVAIGNASFFKPEVVSKAIKRVGRQSIVGVLDVKKSIFGRKYEAFVCRGKEKTNMNHIEYALHLVNLGVGEIILQSIDLDGSMKGFDIQLIKDVFENIDIPLTVVGGAGSLKDIKSLIKEFNIIGVGAGSIFIYKGKHKAVLINYPDQFQKMNIFKNNS